MNESKAARIPFPQYAAGGLTGTVLGLGLGHAIQGRWSDEGYIFTALELTSAAAIVYGSQKCEGAVIVGNSISCKYPDYVTLAGGVFIVSRVWEMIDVWWLPSNLSIGYLPLPDSQKIYLSYRF